MLVCHVTIEMVNIILENKRPFFETMTMSWAPAVQTRPGAPQAPVVQTRPGAAQAPRGVDTSRCSSGPCGVDTSRCSSDPCGVDTSRCSSGPPWCRHVQVQIRPLWCRHVQVQLRPLGCTVDMSRVSRGSFCPYKARCRLGPYGVDMSRVSTGSFCPYKARCRLGPYGVDMSRVSRGSFCPYKARCRLGPNGVDTSRCSKASVVQPYQGANHIKVQIRPLWSRHVLCPHQHRLLLSRHVQVQLRPLGLQQTCPGSAQAPFVQTRPGADQAPMVQTRPGAAKPLQHSQIKVQAISRCRSGPYGVDMSSVHRSTGFQTRPGAAQAPVFQQENEKVKKTSDISSGKMSHTAGDNQHC